VKRCFDEVEAPRYIEYSCVARYFHLYSSEGSQRSQAGRRIDDGERKRIESQMERDWSLFLQAASKSGFVNAVDPARNDRLRGAPIPFILRLFAD
jgi:hypothetical protein